MDVYLHMKLKKLSVASKCFKTERACSNTLYAKTEGARPKVGLAPWRGEKQHGRLMFFASELQSPSVTLVQRDVTQDHEREEGASSDLIRRPPTALFILRAKPKEMREIDPLSVKRRRKKNFAAAHQRHPFLSAGHRCRRSERQQGFSSPRFPCQLSKGTPGPATAEKAVERGKPTRE
jgi:hypothetical protein